MELRLISFFDNLKWWKFNSIRAEASVCIKGYLSRDAPEKVKIKGDLSKEQDVNPIKLTKTSKIVSTDPKKPITWYVHIFQ